MIQRTGPKEDFRFPIEKAKILWAKFPTPARDMTFEQFYKELCDMGDPDKMREDLDTIQMTRARERSNKLMVERALEK